MLPHCYVHLSNFFVFQSLAYFFLCPFFLIFFAQDLYSNEYFFFFATIDVDTAEEEPSTVQVSFPPKQFSSILISHPSPLTGRLSAASGAIFLFFFFSQGNHSFSRFFSFLFVTLPYSLSSFPRGSLIFQRRKQLQGVHSYEIHFRSRNVPDRQIDLQQQIPSLN